MILSDVDGVILNFNKSFVKFYNKKYNKKYKEYHIGNYDYRISLGITDTQFDRLFAEFCVSKEVSKLEYYQSFIDLYDNFKNDDICLVTALPSMCSESRIKNLHKIEFGDIYFETDRVHLCKLLMPDMIFEDCPKNIYEYLKVTDFFGTLCIPVRYWNSFLLHDKTILENKNKIEFYY